MAFVSSVEQEIKTWLEEIIANKQIISPKKKFNVKEVSEIAKEFEEKIDLPIEDFAKYLLNNDQSSILVWLLFARDPNQRISWSEELTDIFICKESKNISPLMFLVKKVRIYDPIIFDTALARCEIDAESGHKNTALIMAATAINVSSDITTVKKLIAAGANPNHTNIFGNTTLFYACKLSGSYSSDECVKILLEAGADPNHISKFRPNICPLTVAISHVTSTLETTRLLLEAGADPNFIHKTGWSTFGIFCRNSEKKLNDVELIETLKLFLKHSANPNSSNSCGWNCFQLAIKYFPKTITTTIIDIFYEAGADFKLKNRNRKTILKLMAEDADPFCIEAYEKLIEYGVSVNDRDFSKHTALSMACQNHETELVDLLLKHNADVSLIDNYGNTPIMYLIVMYEYDTNIVQIAEKLIKAGTVDLSHKNDNGFSILEAIDQSTQESLFCDSVVDVSGITALRGFLHKALLAQYHKSYKLQFELNFLEFKTLSEDKLNCFKEIFEKILDIRWVMFKYPSVSFGFASKLSGFPMDEDLTRHIEMLAYYRTKRINPEDLLLESWDDFLSPVICSNNYWYHLDDMKTLKECPYTRVPMNSLTIKYYGFFKMV